MTTWPTEPTTVTVPATSANLGPGFDSLGLALDLHDEVTVEVVDREGVVVEIVGEGANTLPTGATHLVAATLLHALDSVGERPLGLHLRATNRIPHGRGLGSSAAAIVAGILLARELTGGDSSPIDETRALELAVEAEGHPDNVAPALLGGFTIAWIDNGAGACAVSLPVHPRVRAVVCIPTVRMSTHAARGLLPDSVPHDDAAANAARTALLVHALTTEPSLLLAATSDFLHQSYRCPAMPDSSALLTNLRARGLAATLSGSGPTVMVLITGDDVETVREVAQGFDVQELAIETLGARPIDPR